MEGRLQELITALPGGLRNIAVSDSTRAARQRPLERPLGDFVGSYFNEAYGTVSFAEKDGALAFHWGALWGPVEVFDAARNVLRVELAGSGNTVTFRFDGPGSSKSIELQGVTFVRKL